MGTRVSGVTAGSPAEKAGIKVGDVILELNGHKVDDDNHLVNMVGLMRADTVVPAVVFRDGKSSTVEVRLTARE